MPTISIDTFFACSLMVLVVLSAMAITAKITYPWIYAAGDSEVNERYRAIAEHILLSAGDPKNWGEIGEQPTIFGLANHGCEGIIYDLDPDKVSRLNYENIYALTYGQLFESLNMPDVSLRIEILPIFETKVNLTRIMTFTNGAVYEFKVTTIKDGAYVPVWLQYYTIADCFIINSGVKYSTGTTNFNVTIPYSLRGPALLVVLSKSVYNTRIASFNVYPFQHAGSEPKPKGSFMRISPLNSTLYAWAVKSGLSDLNAYALAFNYTMKLTQKTSNGLNMTYNIPKLYESSPIVLVVAGRTLTESFIEWTVYPQVPVCIGIDYADCKNLVNFYAYSYFVTVESCIYQCRVWLGGPVK